MLCCAPGRLVSWCCQALPAQCSHSHTAQSLLFTHTEPLGGIQGSVAQVTSVLSFCLHTRHAPCINVTPKPAWFVLQPRDFSSEPYMHAEPAGPHSTSLPDMQSSTLFHALLSVCGSECMLGLVVQLGNFSYTVSMHAEPAEAETVPQLQACLGSTARHVLTLHNPVGTETLLQTSCSNPHNFTLSSPTVVLPPYGQTEVTIDYLPSSLGQLTHHCHNVQQRV